MPKNFLNKNIKGSKNIKIFCEDLIENSPDPIFALDKKGDFILFNKTAEEKSGYKKEEILGKNFAKIGLVPAKYLPRVLKELAKRFMGIKASPYAVEIIRKDKTLLPVELNAIIIKKEGKIIGDLIIARDITGRKEAENKLKEYSQNLEEKVKERTAKLQESEEKYRTLVESISDFIYVIDRNNKVLFVNQPGSKALGKRPEEIVGKSIFELFPKEIAQNHSRGLGQVLKSEKSMSFEEKNVFQGKESWINTILSPLKNNQGEITAAIGITRDITARKNMENELKAKTSELEKFNKFAVGRELKMIELKKQIEELKQ